MKFTYMGDHDEVTTWGVTFPRGVPVEVTNATLLRKLPGNSAFEQSAEDTGDGSDAKPSDGLTVPQIKDALAAKGVEIPDGVTKKADLAALLDA